MSSFVSFQPYTKTAVTLGATRPGPSWIILNGPVATARNSAFSTSTSPTLIGEGFPRTRLYTTLKLSNRMDFSLWMLCLRSLEWLHPEIWCLDLQLFRLLSLWSLFCDVGTSCLETLHNCRNSTTSAFAIVTYLFTIYMFPWMPRQAHDLSTF